MICSSINTSVIWVFVDVEQQLWFVLSQMVEIEVSDLKVEKCSDMTRYMCAICND